MELTFRPIVLWPGKPTNDRQRSKFKSSYGQTLYLLDRELRHLNGKNIVMQVALASSDIRLDGKPRSGAKASHPGVILAFDSVHGPLSYPCDRFVTWEENLRAIALSLEYLRAVDRYGVTRGGEQYRGWEQLPGPVAGPTTPREAAEWMVNEAGSGVGATYLIVDVCLRQETYRSLAMRFHPDRGGDTEKFKTLQKAKELLDGT